MFSPPAWGWSAAAHDHTRRAASSPHPRGDGPHGCLRPQTCSVLPTRVGMVRDAAGSVLLTSVFPTRVGMVRIASGSGQDAVGVFPTRVGMVRLTDVRRRARRKFSPPAWGWSVLYWIGAERSWFSPPAWGWSEEPPTSQRHRWRFSPPAWGWSADRGLARSGSTVLPTRVGMVRITSARERSASGFPHARGDGPRGPQAMRRLRGVLPTRVGMVRARGLHARRDAFSPPAWGWSVALRHGGCRCRGSPHAWGWSASCVQGGLQFCFPHARGDGPRLGRLPAACAWFSPRAWGWSANSTGRHGGQAVFPTRVGMVRFRELRGTARRAFSPPAWGWSDYQLRIGEIDCQGSPHARGDGPRCGSCKPSDGDVFPTRVGMVRSTCALRARRTRFSPPAWGWSAMGRSSLSGARCFPHPRGDGPERGRAEHDQIQFSPRAWGWSDPVN